MGNIAQALYIGSTFGWLVLMPSFFVGVWGWSPLAAGSALAPAAAIGAVLSPFAGGPPTESATVAWWSPAACAAQPGRRGGSWRSTPTRLRHATSCPGMVLAGLGITAGFATLTGALMSRVPPRFYSMAGAARSTIFQLATAIGIAVAVAIAESTGIDAVAPFRRVWWVGTACAVCAAIVMYLAFPRHVSD